MGTSAKRANERLRRGGCRLFHADHVIGLLDLLDGSLAEQLKRTTIAYFIMQVKYFTTSCTNVQRWHLAIVMRQETCLLTAGPPYQCKCPTRDCKSLLKQHVLGCSTSGFLSWKPQLKLLLSSIATKKSGMSIDLPVFERFHMQVHHKGGKQLYLYRRV